MTLLGKQAKCCPFPIVTTFDWLWWVNFSMKWKYVGLRMLNRQEVLGRDRAERLHHFFGSHAFQGWALSPEAHAVKFPLFHSRRDGEGRYAWPVYKSLLQAYIHVHALACGWRTDQRPLLRYFKHKEKEGSKHQPGRNFAMDEDFNVIRFSGFSCSVAAAQETYGRQLTRYVKGRRLEGPDECCLLPVAPIAARPDRESEMRIRREMDDFPKSTTVLHTSSSQRTDGLTD